MYRVCIAVYYDCSIHCATHLSIHLQISTITKYCCWQTVEYPRRQDLPLALQENGAIYIHKAADLMHNGRSHAGSRAEWDVAEHAARQVAQTSLSADTVPALSPLAPTASHW